eukprot:scaffold159619_cov30-Tisochrysis_lutea.AAC.2
MLAGASFGMALYGQNAQCGTPRREESPEERVASAIDSPLSIIDHRSTIYFYNYNYNYNN